MTGTGNLHLGANSPAVLTVSEVTRRPTRANADAT